MVDELVDLLAPTVAPFGLELVEVEVRAGLVRVVVDGPEGAPLDAIAEATRAVSSVLDANDPLPGIRYTLEVSSPGVERPLRTPSHFARAVGETVTVRTLEGAEGERRFTGTLTAADDEGFVLAGAGPGDAAKRFAYEDIERARTVFRWEPAERARRGAPRRAARHGTEKKKVRTP